MAYVSAAEAARLTGVSERTVRRWAASGQVRSVKRGHGYRVALPEVAAMVGQADGLGAASDPAMADSAAILEGNRTPPDWKESWLVSSVDEAGWKDVVSRVGRGSR